MDPKWDRYVIVAVKWLIPLLNTKHYVLQLKLSMVEHRTTPWTLNLVLR